MMRPLAVLAVLALALSGCSGSATDLPDGDGAVVVHSKPPEQEVRSDGSQAPKTREETPIGIIAGVVVDEAYNPLVNATVELPGMDMVDVTDWQGGFAFSQLPIGNYRILAKMFGYYDAETVVEVEADKATVEVRFVLRMIPPPDPYHVTQHFEGFADITQDPILGFGPSCTCTFWAAAGGPGFRALVIDARMDEYAGVGGVGGSNSFHYEVADPCCRYSYVAYGDGGNPLNVVVPASGRWNPQSESSVSVHVAPEGFPLPETSKKFDVWTTQWFNQDPPMDWSFLGTEPQ